MNITKEAGDLGEYQRARDWLERHRGNPVFPTYSSLEWFVKQHRRELVEEGALITRGGRAGSLVHNRRFPKLAITILRREALEHQSVGDA